MRFFIYTEFIERGRKYPIELISLGVVAEDGRELYLVSDEFEAGHASDWVRDNVLRQIWLDSSTAPTSVDQIAEQLSKFVGGGEPEFWGYYADYDWVVVCQMFGTMVDLPQGLAEVLQGPEAVVRGPRQPNVAAAGTWGAQRLERRALEPPSLQILKRSCGILGW